MGSFRLKSASILFDEIAKTVGGNPDGFEYDVLNKENELRYTLGPIYLPDTIDSQNEFTDSDELRKMVWQYFSEGDKTLRKQHTPTPIGKVVEIVQWPFEQELDMQVGGQVRKFKFPAGTVYAGAQWDPSVWPDVKAGRITGFSMGGKAVRLRNAADSSSLHKVEFA